MPHPVENPKLSAAPPAGTALDYFAGGGGSQSARLWEAAPGRCVALVVAWVITLLALFLPGCDMSGPGGGGSDVQPTYTVYALTAEYTLSVNTGLREAARGQGSSPLFLGNLAMPVACPLFLLGSVVFLLTPLLLGRRVRGRFRRLEGCVLPLVLAPWVLLAAAGVSGDAGRFLYGYYLLAAGHTAAFVIVALPPPGRAGMPVGPTS